MIDVPAEDDAGTDTPRAFRLMGNEGNYTLLSL